MNNSQLCRFTISLKLPPPPSVNGMYLNAMKRRGKGRILKSSARDYKQNVVIEFLRQTSAIERASMPWTCPVEVHFRMWPTTKARYDTGNFTKAVFDALNGHLWVDDCQIHLEHLEKAGFSQPGYCTLDVSPYVKER